MTGFDYLPDYGADYVHFGCRKPIATRKVAGGAGWANIGADMRESVINPVKPTGAIGSSTINARLDNQFVNFLGSEIACINSGVCLAQKYRPAFISFVVPPISFNSLLALFRGMVRPPVRTVVAPEFSCPVAGSAFIAQAKGPRTVADKNFGRCREQLIATVAMPKAFNGGNMSCSHSDSLTNMSTLGKDGTHYRMPCERHSPRAKSASGECPAPHFELDRAAFPSGRI